MAVAISMQGVEELRLDPENPRFTGARSLADLPAFLDWFISDADLVGLAGSIAANGYFPGEPLIVSRPREGDDDERLVVVEGNRRFAAVLLLLNPEYVPRRGSIRELSESADLDSLRKLPCVVYPKRDDILEYLGHRHIEGVKAWDPLAKARYLRQLRDRAERNEEPADDRALARKIGSKANYVRRLLRTLEAFEVLEEAEVVREDEARFSVLSTALSYSNISDLAGIGFSEAEPATDREALIEMGRWMFETDAQGNTRVGDSRNLRDLNDVVGDGDALEKFREGASLSEAARASRASSEALTSALQEASVAMREAIKHAGRLNRPATPTDKAEVETIRELAGTLEELFAAADEAGTE